MVEALSAISEKLIYFLLGASRELLSNQFLILEFITKIVQNIKRFLAKKKTKIILVTVIPHPQYYYSHVSRLSTLHSSITWTLCRSEGEQTSIEPPILQAVSLGGVLT